MPFVVAMGLAALVAPIAARAAPSFGLVDQPELPDVESERRTELKIHVRPTPVVGGIALLAGVFTSLAVGAPMSLSVVAAAGIAFVAGTADDVRPMPPWLRVQLQLLAAVVLGAGGSRFGPEGAVGIAGLALLVLACTNAVNLVDGQDGLVAGLGAIAAVVLGLVGSVEAKTLGLATAGALVGFLVWNRPPARIFLGNGGAYALGILLAALVADVTSSVGVRGMVGGGLCLAVFAFELVLTVARRLASGAPLVAGDRRHSYDVLSARLGSRTRSTVLFWIAGAVCAGAGLLIAG